MMLNTTNDTTNNAKTLYKDNGQQQKQHQKATSSIPFRHVVIFFISIGILANLLFQPQQGNTITKTQISFQQQQQLQHIMDVHHGHGVASTTTTIGLSSTRDLLSTTEVEQGGNVAVGCNTNNGRSVVQAEQAQVETPVAVGGAGRSNDLLSSPLLMYEEDDFPKEIIEQVRVARQQSRPYGDYCSTEVLNEHLLLPYASKKLLAYNLFYSDRKNYTVYFDGMKHNIKNAAKYYPDWYVRVYVYDLSNDMIQNLITIDKSRVEVVICNSTSPLGKNTFLKSTSRFFAADDPSISVYLSRDSDGRISLREVMAVNEFLASNEVCFHSMRDHFAHKRSIMAGMNGMKRGCLGHKYDNTNNNNATSATSTTSTKKVPITMTSLLNEQVKLHENRGGLQRFKNGYDQIFLRDVVYKLVQNKTMQHTTWNGTQCNNEPYDCRPFPLESSMKNPKYFVGQQWDTKEQIAQEGYICTLECLEPGVKKQ